MELTTADGVSIWWEAEGDGPPAVLVPGRGDSTDLFPTEVSDELVASIAEMVALVAAVPSLPLLGRSARRR